MSGKDLPDFRSGRGLPDDDVQKHAALFYENNERQRNESNQSRNEDFTEDVSVESSHLKVHK